MRVKHRKSKKNHFDPKIFLSLRQNQISLWGQKLGQNVPFKRCIIRLSHQKSRLQVLSLLFILYELMHNPAKWVTRNCMKMAEELSSKLGIILHEGPFQHLAPCFSHNYRYSHTYGHLKFKFLLSLEFSKTKEFFIRLKDHTFTTY